MEREVRVKEVKVLESRSGNTRYVLVDEHGNEYTTFRPAIGQRAQAAESLLARIQFHEQERGEFRNVYLDAIEALETQPSSEDVGDQADEAAWRTAIDAAPWLAGEPTPKGELPAEALFEKLKPFKDLVEADIEDGEGEGRRPGPTRNQGD
jgi:hypothetical protein